MAIYKHGTADAIEEEAQIVKCMWMSGLVERPTIAGLKSMGMSALNAILGEIPVLRTGISVAQGLNDAEAQRVEATNTLVIAAIEMLHGWASTIERNSEDITQEHIRWYAAASDKVKFAISDLARGENVDANIEILLRHIREDHQRSWG